MTIASASAPSSASSALSREREIRAIAVDAPRLVHRDRIVRPHARAGLPQLFHQARLGASRMSSVFGLKARPQSAIVRPCRSPSK